MNVKDIPEKNTFTDFFLKQTSIFSIRSNCSYSTLAPVTSIKFICIGLSYISSIQEYRQIDTSNTDSLSNLKCSPSALQLLSQLIELSSRFYYSFLYRSLSFTLKEFKTNWSIDIYLPAKGVNCDYFSRLLKNLF